MEKTRDLDSTTRSVLVVLIVASIVAVVPGLLYAWNAVAEVSAEVEASSLRLAQLASAQADRILSEAYFELEVVSQLVDFDSVHDETTAIEIGPTGRLRVSSFHTAIIVIDPSGRILAEEPLRRLRNARLAQVTAEVDLEDRAVTEPWTDPVSGHVVVGLSVPIIDNDGTRTASVVGIVDLTEPLIADLVMPAARLGLTGHADLLDERGLVLASTEAGHVMTPGDHPEFYGRAVAERIPVVEDVVHELDANSLDRSPRHIMAYAPLRNAPWGIAMGASEEESLGVVRRLGLRLVAAAAASAAALALAIWFVARDLRAAGRRPQSPPAEHP